MERLQHWGIMICCAALAIGMIQMILPESSIKKTLDIVLRAFLVCCVISPVGSMLQPQLQNKLHSFEKEQSEYITEYSDISKDIFQTIACDKIGRLTHTKLNEMGINQANVSVYINQHDSTLTEEDITIECVLPADLKNRHEEICRRLEYELGTTIRIGYEENFISMAGKQ